VFHEAGGGSCGDEDLVGSSRSRRSSWSGNASAQAARDLDVHENVLRKWVKEFGSDPVQAFPGHGQMKPEQMEIERLRREVNKLKAEWDILKNCHGPMPACAR
jgi:transposase